ncbi:MAG: hypothetical protein K2N64_06435 [Anaeroplasmataceae bacterium]|nr:hypothetical protein [Anaeroplasmataceae bacterium]
MKKPVLYIVGDSTVSSFSDPYYYPRYGYGTQLGCYLEEIEIINLALSGRSSKSFIEEKNYELLFERINKGDFLLVGFGHNDEKSDDPLRFTDASKPIEDPTSFMYYLYEYYIMPAKKKGAVPILCTPICRVDLSDDYTKNSGHITSNGNYKDAICSLGRITSIPVLDLTEETKKKYEKIGHLEAMSYHATIAGKYKADGKTLAPDLHTVDTTHLNIFGAKYVAYLVASLLKKTNCSLKAFVKENIVEPTKDVLIPNSEYQVRVYEAPNLDAYVPENHFKTLTSGWYGTAFGDCGGCPDEEEHGFIAKEIERGIFQVGQSGSAAKGKISLLSDGLAFCFRKIDIHDNFKLEATARVLKTAHVKQSGFGLMLRDDSYVHQKSSSEMITSNFLAVGFVTTDVTMSPIFYREQTELHKEEPLFSYLYQTSDTAKLRISRVGQSMTLEMEYKDQIYHKTYVDFDLLAVDHKYMYVGLFASRGTLAEFFDVDFEITGKSQGA